MKLANNQILISLKRKKGVIPKEKLTNQKVDDQANEREKHCGGEVYKESLLPTLSGNRNTLNQP